MTVTSFLNYKEYQGDGVAKTFAIPFLLLNQDDLKVYIDNKLLAGGYNLTGIGNPISSITFIEAPEGKVLLQRSIDLLRDTDYQENGDLLADTLNRDFDRIYLAMQGSAQNTSQALRVADPEGVNVLPLRDIRANKLLGFDSQGQPSLSTIESDSAVGLASALADTTEKHKGASLVGFNDALKYPQNTVGYALKNTIPLFTTQWWPDRKNIPDGYVAADGQELSHVAYPDVTSLLRSGQMPQVSNDLWLSDPTKRGCYVADTGNGTFRLPDYNGMQSSSIGALFVRGGNGSIADGVVQGDAIRNITGSFSTYRWNNGGTSNDIITGAFTGSNINNATLANGSVAGTALYNFYLDASKVVATAEENRPVNVTGCWIIRLFSNISNTSGLDASKLAAEYSVLSTRLTTVETKQQESCFKIVYPNGGTVDNPANVTINNRYVMDNPFDGHPVIVQAEIYYNNLWSNTGYMYSDTAKGQGVMANHVIELDKIIIQTGSSGLIWANSSFMGNAFGSSLNSAINNLPCRVKVWRID